MTTPPPPIPQLRNSALAIWSLVLGIIGLVSFFCIGILFAIPAVICGHVALGRINRSAGTLGGYGLALAGLIIGYVSLGLTILMVPLAIPNFIKARETARRNTCINNLRLIDGAKQQWALDNNKTANDTPTAQDLDKYFNGPNPGFDALHCPEGGTYSINKVSEPPTCSVPGHQIPGDSQAQ